MTRLSLLALAGALARLCLRAEAQSPSPAVPPVREVSPGIYEMGSMRIDQKARTLTLPAHLNMNEGPLEYLMTTEHGSSHESLLVSDLQPTEVHVAMLLLGAKGAPAPADGKLPPPQIDLQYLKTAPKLGGESISIEVRWKQGEETKLTPVEDWIFNTQTKAPMERGPWTYNGSMMNDGHFLAQVEGAFAALVIYPSALINNPRKGDDNDQIWTVNEKAVPALNTPVEVIVTILPNPKPHP